MSRRAAFLTAALAALTLTACAPERTPAYEDGKHLEESHLRLHDGREITCITYHSYKQGGLSCDWGSR